MKTKILSTGSNEAIRIVWDGERFALIEASKESGNLEKVKQIIILNPKEMLDLIQFAGNLGEE